MTVTRKWMALLLCATLLLGLVPFAAVARAATDGIVPVSGEGAINARRVNIRPEPSTKNTPFGKANKGDGFRVTGFTIPSGFSQGFFQVEGGAAGGKAIEGKAYVAGNYLYTELTTALTGEVTKKGHLYKEKTTANAGILRQSLIELPAPSRGYRKAEEVAVGDHLQLLAREGKWWRTELNGELRMVLAEHVQKVFLASGALQSAQASGIKLTTVAKLASNYVKVSGSAVRNAGFVGWRRHSEGNTYTDQTGFSDITSLLEFRVTSGWYAVGVVDAAGQFRYELIYVEAASSSAGDSSGGGSHIFPQRTPVGFTADEVGGTPGQAASTSIKLTFDKPVTGLTLNDISIGPGTGTQSGEAAGAGLICSATGSGTGTGTEWILSLTVTKQGIVDVNVGNFGSYAPNPATQSVQVFVNNQDANAAADNIKNNGISVNAASTTASSLGFKVDGFTQGVTLTLVSTKTGAAGPGTETDLGASIINGILYLDTQKLVDAADLTYVGVTFTTTVNGVTSDEVTMDISNQFGAGTTVGKLRADKATLLGAAGAALGQFENTGKNINTYYDIISVVTLSNGVSFGAVAASSCTGVGMPDPSGITLKADAGAGIQIAFTVLPTSNGMCYWQNSTIVLSCAGTSYTLSGANLSVEVVNTTP